MNLNPLEEAGYRALRLGDSTHVRTTTHEVKGLRAVLRITIGKTGKATIYIELLNEQRMEVVAVDWMDWDRVVSVMSEARRAHYEDGLR